MIVLVLVLVHVLVHVRNERGDALVMYQASQQRGMHDLVRPEERKKVRPSKPKEECANSWPGKEGAIQ